MNWRDEVCVCNDETPHIHCPWDGAHVHYVSADDEDISPPEGHKLRAAYKGEMADGKDHE